MTRNRLNLVHVEDDAAVAELVSLLLEQAGFHVTSVATALEALREADKTPHVFLVDVELPDLDGYSLSRLLRERLPEAAIIILTGHYWPRWLGVPHLRKAILSGADDLIEKPFQPRRLLDAIRRSLRSHTPDPDEMREELAHQPVRKK